MIILGMQGFYDHYEYIILSESLSYITCINGLRVWLLFHSQGPMKYCDTWIFHTLQGIQDLGNTEFIHCIRKTTHSTISWITLTKAPSSVTAHLYS